MGTDTERTGGIALGKTQFMVDLENEVTIISQDGKMVSIPLADLFAFVAVVRRNRFLVIDHHKRTIFATPEFRSELGEQMAKSDGGLVVIDTVNDEETYFTTRHVRRVIQKGG